MTREVLVGSIPLSPATTVFETVAQELGGLVARISDGDQHGWIRAAWAAFERNDALEIERRDELVRGGATVPVFRLKARRNAADVRELGPYGFADTAFDSYAEFKRLRDEGVIDVGTRFQVTLPGPMTTVFAIQLPPEQLVSLATEALKAEVQKVVSAIPAEDLAFKFDIAIEVEREEYRRTPEAFDAPMYDTFEWSMEQMLDAVASVSNSVPAEAELGYHMCSMWHHYLAGGQDNSVIVDVANGIRARLRRPINYIHVPAPPQHGETDFQLLRDLELDPETKLYLGLIHVSDGLEGTLRRIEAAEAVLPDFGVAFYCGLRGPSIDASKLPEIFALHRDAATHAAS